jgi:hypothetical protein
VQPLIQPLRQCLGGGPSPPEIWENSWARGGAPKKSDPAYLAVSRVSLGRGYLVVRVRWTESPSGVRVFKIFLAGPRSGRSPKDSSPRTVAPRAKRLPGKIRQVAYPRIRLNTWVKPPCMSGCQQGAVHKRFSTSASEQALLNKPLSTSASQEAPVHKRLSPCPQAPVHRRLFPVLSAPNQSAPVHLGRTGAPWEGDIGFICCGRWPDGPVGVNVFGKIVSARPGGSRGSGGSSG